MPFLKTLSKTQFDAATQTEGAVLIVAGAGSGKTRVLTSRIAHLILNKKVDPANILAVTFTNKAASEIRERLEKLVGPVAEKVMAGTFHTVGLKMLQEEHVRSGRKGALTIYDEDDQLLLVKFVMSELGIEEKEMPSKSVVWEINLAKNDNITPYKYLSVKGDAFSAVVARIYAAYQKKLEAMVAVDFGDLICRPMTLLATDPEALARYSGRFRYVLVDEFQDTNKSQYEFTKLLASTHKNLCAVGDPDQSIYGWRGASIDNILKFREDYTGARYVKLEQNYRSTKNILGAANSVILRNEQRLEKTLWTGNPDGEMVSYEECLNEYQEARFVTNTIKKLISADPQIKFKDFTILCRTNTQSRPFEELFFEESVPYKVLGGFKFFDRREIKDALAYLKALANPDDSLNFLRIVNVPPRGIGKAALEKVHSIANANGLTLYEAFRKAAADKAFSKGGVIDFIESFERLRHGSRDMGLAEIASSALYASGYMAFWEAKKTEDSEERLQNLEGLISAIKNFETSRPKADLADYLNLVALMSDADNYDEKNNRVTIMTIHSAKGLEFPFVFLVGMEEGLFPHKRSVDEGTLEEERRLCYVGMTRAKRLLFLLSAKNRSAGKETSLQIRSRFIDEIAPDFLRKKELCPKGTAEEHIQAIKKLFAASLPD